MRSALLVLADGVIGCLQILSLHDALPICDALLPSARALPDVALAAAVLWRLAEPQLASGADRFSPWARRDGWLLNLPPRSEEHTSELQSRFEHVCRLLLEKKNLPGFDSLR